MSFTYIKQLGQRGFRHVQFSDFTYKILNHVWKNEKAVEYIVLFCGRIFNETVWEGDEGEVAP